MRSLLFILAGFAVGYFLMPPVIKHMAPTYPTNYQQP